MYIDKHNINQIIKKINLSNKPFCIFENEWIFCFINTEIFRMYKLACAGNKTTKWLNVNSHRF